MPKGHYDRSKAKPRRQPDARSRGNGTSTTAPSKLEDLIGLMRRIASDEIRLSDLGNLELAFVSRKLNEFNDLIKKSHGTSRP